MKKNSSSALLKPADGEVDYSDILVCIIIAVYKPNSEFLYKQLSSIAHQTHNKVKLFVINSDMQSEMMIAKFCREFKLDFILLTPEQKLDATHAFEFGLRYVVDHQAELSEFVVALGDQDDIWELNKLEIQLKSLKQNNVSLVHSDASLIDSSDRKTSDSVFKSEGRLKRSDIRSLLYINNITGMTAMFEGPVAVAALPFPKQNGKFFYHDLWLGLVASIQKGVYFIDQPLVKYRQHENNVVGAVGGNKNKNVLRTSSKLKRSLNTYYLASYLAKSLYVRSVEVQSIGNQINQNELSNLKPYLSTYDINLRFLKDSAVFFLGGRRRQSRAAFAHFVGRNVRLGLAFRNQLGFGLGNQLEILDRQRFSLVPGVQPAVVLQNNQPKHSPISAKPWRDYVDSRKYPTWASKINKDRHVATNVLVPSLNPNEMFAGIATAIDLGVKLAELGERVRFIATNAPISFPSTSLSFIKERLRNEDAIERIEIECGVSNKSIEFNIDDRFVATAWWTAHIASQLVTQFSKKEFIYLIQDFESNFYPWGDDYSNALESYRFDYLPVYNTSLLRDYFENSRLVKARPNPICFRPSIKVEEYANLPRPHNSNEKRRFLLYGRPEVARNMFGSAVEAICGFIEANDVQAVDVEFHSIGLKHEPIMMPNGIILTSVGKIGWDQYPRFLTGYDFGLALMLSPHPSHLPIEMAAAGIRVVTNGFANKNISNLSPLILSAEPNVHSIQAELEKAYSQLNNFPTKNERMIDLTSLGGTLDEAVETLHKRLSEN